MYAGKRRAHFVISKLSCLLTVLLCILCGCSAAEKISYTYEAFAFVDHTTYGISGYTIKGDRFVVDTVEIPSEHNGRPVTYILDRAFYSCNMRELRMETVIELWEDAFKLCTHLTSVDLGAVERIGDRAFYSCTALKSVTIPKTVTRIGLGAFESCSNLEAVYFEVSPESIGDHVFDPGVTLYGPAGSSVEEYAKINDLEFVSWEPGGGQ